MKPTLLIAALSMVVAAPSAFAKSEVETLRALCQEQKRQINELEEANERLRADRSDAHPLPAKTEAKLKDADKPTAVAKPTATPAPAPSTYTVKAGDNLEKIARKMGANPEKLAKANGLKTNSIIHPGQMLKIPGNNSSRPTPAVAATTDSSPKASGKTHKVQSGETLSSISKKHGMSAEALAAANPKVKSSSLRPGQVVSLGGDAPATTLISTPAHAKTPPTVDTTPKDTPATVTKSPPAREAVPAVTSATLEPKSAADPAKSPAAEKNVPAPVPAPAAAADRKIRPITIDREMTYGDFATKHGTNAERLNALNGLDLTTATVLAKGSELYVPAQP